MSIKTNITTSGNSKAVRLPKSLLQLTGIQDKVELTVKDGSIVITPVNNSRPRENWDQKIEADIKKNGPYTVSIEDEYGVINPNTFDDSDLGELTQSEDMGIWQ